MNSRWTIPGRFIDLLYQDGEFFRDVSVLKKAALSKFPKSDQWYDESGLNMNFALAGYGPDDISILVVGNELVVESAGLDEPNDHEPEVRDDGTKEPLIEMHRGMFHRGIARRKFRTKFLISPELDVSQTKATMDNGLLKVTIPPYQAQPVTRVQISQES